ncbi:TetR family transcriptional regulator (plasmid) [Streptomyces sp. NBC_00053]|uniref:TetR/AcrR family transcriptional regulator n=1 Tax=unclassified Streptomyces TaxID=2593676 RepID=UPI000F5C2832|nr:MULTISPECIES: TetR/AcrR family transcriptional regulator [unclassified Streptomyces]WSG56352.1 TetR family transcriptional regulator [Streptomyces sp. NBC_01732]WSX07518.1 TetR family transcriptional regulator [Streptomyces sp. NBC_00987]MCX4399798.1 TetR family transcriptional regulator [Streptomyces sp. NBC_01767]MCX5106413.1 TetR family transcriptional regulator [Streptomyces sp. NBC_00439]MCX5505653.1 TetR family transcriptional regulator [Streptomyces sp. NBC_00052]
MPPAPGDREARRDDVSRAVWQVLADKGFGGLTLRAVAAAMGVSTGMLMHYFPTKRALIAHALDLLEKRTAERPRRDRPADGLATVRAMLLDILPLTEGDTARNRIWVSSWDLALADDGLATDQADRYTRLRSTLRPHFEAARGLGEVPAAADPEQLAATAVAFTHGLVVQALFDPGRFPEDVQIAMVDDFLASITPPRPARR